MAVSPPHLVHVFATFEPYDAQVRTTGLINHFGPRFRHTILTMDRRAGARALISRELDVGVIGPPGSRRLLPVRFGSTRSLLRLLRPEMILTYGFDALASAFANQWSSIAPQIHHEDGFDDHQWLRARWPRAQLRRLACSGVTRVVVPSRALERIALRSWGIACDKVCRIANGIDVDRFARAPDPDAIPGFERQPGELIVGTVSGFRRVENLERLVRVFAMTRHGAAARLVIVGDGPTRGDVIRVLVEHDLESRILLPGHVPGPEGFLGLFDIFAMSSAAEQVPLRLMEAMAAGLPAIATEVGDVKAMVSEPNRDFVVDPDNEAAFAAKLDGLMRDGQLRMGLGRANRAKAQRDFRFETMAKAWAELLDDVLSGHPAPVGDPGSVL
jgi:glycosyltransferase involved in cell wall biosynthesis